MKTIDQVRKNISKIKSSSQAQHLKIKESLSDIVNLIEAIYPEAKQDSKPKTNISPGLAKVLKKPTEISDGSK